MCNSAVAQCSARQSDSKRKSEIKKSAAFVSSERFMLKACCGWAPRQTCTVQSVRHMKIVFQLIFGRQKTFHYSCRMCGECHAIHTHTYTIQAYTVHIQEQTYPHPSTNNRKKPEHGTMIEMSHCAYTLSAHYDGVSRTASDICENGKFIQFSAIVLSFAHSHSQQSLFYLDYTKYKISFCSMATVIAATVLKSAVGPRIGNETWKQSSMFKTSL